MANLPARLLEWLTLDRSQIAGDRLPVSDNRGSLIFQDHGADVLLVAHVDHVAERDAKPERVQIQGTRLQHACLDDRLGCFAIEELHRRGVKADLLYTDCEETGRTTGAEFSPSRDYKFMLSLDRKGVDAVLYQYDDEDEWKRFCARHIGPVEFGSFSCIASMEHLGICGANIGIGYFEHNTSKCWADTRLTMAQIDRTQAFVARARQRAWPFVCDDIIWEHQPSQYASLREWDEQEEMLTWKLGNGDPDVFRDGTYYGSELDQAALHAYIDENLRKGRDAAKSADRQARRNNKRLVAKIGGKHT